MADNSSSNAQTSTTDAADRLYPGAGGNQGTGNNDSSGNSSPEAASPHVVTNMTDGKTVYFDPNTGESFEMETRNAVDQNRSKDGADDPYFGRITGVVYPEGDNNQRKYGWAMVTTDDERHRWIHGGGSGLNKPMDARQGWVPTLGCTRGQNEDVQELAKKIEQFQKDHPNVPIMYYRVRPEQ